MNLVQKSDSTVSCGVGLDNLFEKLIELTATTEVVWRIHLNVILYAEQERTPMETFAKFAADWK